MSIQEFTKYRFINELTGDVVYLMSIDSSIEHEFRIDRKKNDLSYRKGIDYNDIICERIH